MWIDFHSHILPGMDDGAKNAAVSVKLLRMLREQGVQCVALTPHFYAHRESVEDFLARRKRAFEQLLAAIGDEPMPELLLGAEIALECDLDQVTGLDQLRLQGTPYLMIELPAFYHYMPWMLEQAKSVCRANDSQLMLAHLERYIGIYSEDQLSEIVFESDALVQLTISSLKHYPLRKQMLNWIRDGRPIVFGSDAHNLTNRKPRFDKGLKRLQRKVSATEIERIKAIAQTVWRGGIPRDIQSFSLLMKEC